MSQIPSTYNGLVSAVKAVAEDETDEFVNYIPTAIFLAEKRLMKELDIDGMKLTAVVTASANNQLLPKPDKYRFGYSLTLKTSAGDKVRPTKRQQTFIYK